MNLSRVHIYKPIYDNYITLRSCGLSELKTRINTQCEQLDLDGCFGLSMEHLPLKISKLTIVNSSRSFKGIYNSIQSVDVVVIGKKELGANGFLDFLRIEQSPYRILHDNLMDYPLLAIINKYLKELLTCHVNSNSGKIDGADRNKILIRCKADLIKATLECNI